MPAMARSRTFQRRGYVELATGFQERGCVITPVIPVEVHRQEVAYLVPEHRVDTHHEIATSVVAA